MMPTPASVAEVRANGPDVHGLRGRYDRLGIVAAGKAFTDTMQALRDLGLGDAQLAELGVRVLKIGLLYPLEPQAVRDFAEGLDEIVVVEEKRDLVDSQLRSVLYDLPRRP